MSLDTAEHFYAEHRGRFFYPRLLYHMTRYVRSALFVVLCVTLVSLFFRFS